MPGLTHTHPQPIAPRHLALILVVCMLWGVNAVVAAISVSFLSPLWLAACRLSLMAAPCVFARLPRRYWLATAVYGLGTFGIQFSLYYEALRLGMPAGVSSVVAQTHVVWSLVLGATVLHERAGPAQWIGCAVAFVGVGVMCWPGAAVEIPLPALALALLGPACGAVGAVAIRKAPGVSNLSLNAWGSAASLPLLIPIAWWLEGAPGERMLGAFTSPVFLAAFLFQGLVASAICFPSWTRMIAKYGLSKVVPFTLLVPLSGVGAAILFLGERWTPRMALGVAIVAAGLAIVQWLPLWLGTSRRNEETA